MAMLKTLGKNWGKLGVTPRQFWASNRRGGLS